MLQSITATKCNGMTTDEAIWTHMEHTVIELLRRAFRINCYTTDKGDFVFVDQEILPDSVAHNVWNFTPAQFRSHVKCAVEAESEVTL